MARLVRACGLFAARRMGCGTIVDLLQISYGLAAVQRTYDSEAPRLNRWTALVAMLAPDTPVQYQLLGAPCFKAAIAVYCIVADLHSRQAAPLVAQPLVSALRAAAVIMCPPCSSPAGRQVASRTLWTRGKIAVWTELMCHISEVSSTLPVTTPGTCTESWYTYAMAGMEGLTLRYAVQLPECHAVFPCQLQIVSCHR